MATYRTLALITAILVGCNGDGVHGSAEPIEATAADTGASGPHWTPLSTDGLVGTWGSFPAGRHHVGGIAGLSMGMGTTDLRTYQVQDDTLVASVRGVADVPRYCGCAFEDVTRDELVIVGGRNDGFSEEPTAERVAADGLATSLEHDGAADHPVGCAAFYAASVDRGYVFGGARGGALSDQLWRYDPGAGSFTALDVPGPSARYDAGLVQLSDGRVYLVGGRTDDGMASDVWRFDPATETWTELPPSTEAPAGRRFPFLVGDTHGLYYGYGTSSPTGQRMLKDMWHFDLTSQVWEKLSFEGDVPANRGFAVSLQGPEGSLGVLAFGFDGDREVYEDAWAFWP